ncbi:MAG: hypothetical protein KME22_31145 [Hassallia sp. WJT32-NPBG1]|jgi:Asp-tRNA(Asn)/Glu-tRNA(Gln) amidotransferase A subunit family amidase|nr:hypothetical protein [Hassallia sp. WJT32-NPBG1]
MDAIINLSATEIAQAIAKGELSASEVVEAHIERIMCLEFEKGINIPDLNLRLGFFMNNL